MPDRLRTSDLRYLGSELTDFDIIAREVSGYRTRLEAIEKRLGEVEKVNARLEEAALIKARALAEISGHWEAVYEAMRRTDGSQLPLCSEYQGGALTTRARRTAEKSVWFRRWDRRLERTRRGR